MSDTDDTDDLLLIPPDFFVVHSNIEDQTNFYGPYYNVVDSLITQVNKLESRINSIEASPDASYMGSSLDYFMDGNNYRTNLMSSARRFSSWEDIPRLQDIGSTQSTPQKPRTRVKLNSLPSTPSTDRYIPDRFPVNRIAFKAHHEQKGKPYIPSLSNKEQHSYRSSVSSNDNRQQQKAQTEMLSEIDNFISNVNTIKKFQAVRNLNPEFESSKLSDEKSTVVRKPEINVNDVDNMLHAMESQQREIESRLKEKEHELNINRKLAEEKAEFYREKTWQQGDNKGSVPDRGMGMRDIMYNDQCRTTMDNKLPEEKEFYKERTWRQGDNKGSVPDRGMGMRDIMYNDQYRTTTNNKESVKEDVIRRLTVTNLNSCNPSTSDLSARNSDSLYSDNSPSLSSSDLTQLTAYQNKNPQIAKDNGMNIEAEKIHVNAMQVLNKHKNLLSRNSVNNPSVESDHQTWNRSVQKSDKPTFYSYKNDLFAPKPMDYDTSNKNQLALLSLAELWNQTTAADMRSRDHSKCLNKLQEEKLRRQHCEQLIHELQTRTLELQERIAVAVQVDQAKDDAILRVHKSWEEAASTIDNLNKEKVQLEQQIEEIKARTAFELSEAAKKMNHYENESSKALNLAHNNQEKLVTLEKQNTFYEVELQSLQIKLKTIEDNYTAELDKNQQLSKIISQKEIELSENKNILTEARKEVAQSKRAVELCQAELISIKNSQTHLETKFAEELERAKGLELGKTQLLNEIETHKKIEKSLQDDLNKQKHLNEQNKVELRNFYQDQVEVVVRDKLREFQAQLEKAENSIQDEIRNRELSVAKAAAVHIQQVTEKHALEVHLLEEKQKEEVKLYKLQLSQAQQQIDNLHAKIQQQQERRSNIAQQLHKVMEAQWLEAIKIINNGRSPIVSQDKGTNTIDQLNSLKSKSYNNLEEILFKEDTATVKAGGDFRAQKAHPPLFQSIDSISSIIDDDLYDKSTQLPTETPVTSRPKKSRQQMENELQKYVHMLLNRSPGNPVDEQVSRLNEKYKNQQTSCDKLNSDGTKSNKGSSRDHLGKPPWK
ncbi:hypothetical protein ILUMI_05526 [Ignelater luminosus]|uniref:Centrobin n=1 Tax=Ignelater luminosus TaxID=2038154 RepID=A0A8K0DCE0_IGNLU|nr:hypothetical protein ILUMI_05526 [Ignelater luminosus]